MEIMGCKFEGRSRFYQTLVDRPRTRRFEPLHVVQDDSATERSVELAPDALIVLCVFPPMSMPVGACVVRECAEFRPPLMWYCMAEFTVRIGDQNMTFCAHAFL